MPNSDACTWFGVACDSAGDAVVYAAPECVILIIHNMVVMIGSAVAVRSLKLAGNGLNGTIPGTIGNLSQLSCVLGQLSLSTLSMRLQVMCMSCSALSTCHTMS